MLFFEGSLSVPCFKAYAKVSLLLNDGGTTRNNRVSQSNLSVFNLLMMRSNSSSSSSSSVFSIVNTGICLVSMPEYQPPQQPLPQQESCTGPLSAPQPQLPSEQQAPSLFLGFFVFIKHRARGSI